MQTRRQALVADYRVNGADHADLDACRFEYAVDQVRRRGFAIGAGHTDHDQLSRRVAVIGGGQSAYRHLSVLNLRIGYAALDLHLSPLADDSHSPTLYR